MAITSELIGKLGGADVEVIPVSGTNSGSSGTSVILHTVVVPEGETWLVAVIGDMSASTTIAGASPDLMIGNIKTNRYKTQKRMTVAGIHTGTVDVKMARNISTNSDSFTGHVYTVKM